MTVAGLTHGIWISMPEWTDSAIIISVRPHGETNAVVNLLTETRGRHAGLVQAGLSSKQKNTIMIGNLVQADWRARLPEQLGTLKIEAMRTSSAAYLDDPVKLAGLGAICSLLETALAEREPQPTIWESTNALLEIMSLSEDDSWLFYFIRWELGILASAGFGLALDRCAVTGEKEGLAYISPKTGHAVTDAAAGAYKDRLLPLPAFLGGAPTLSTAEGSNDEHQPMQDIMAGLAISGHFLRKHIFALMHKDLPPARLRLGEVLENQS